MRWILVVGVLLISSLGDVNAADVKPEDIIAKHLDSIGTADARAAIKSRGIQGALRFKDLVGKMGDQVGYWGFVSAGHKSNFVMKFGSGEWHGERFVFDGDKASFAVFTSSHRPSAFGDFVRSRDFMLKEGLLGGELSTGWALENLDDKRVRLDYIGHKKMDGHEVEGIQYFSKGNDMTVTLYFDPDSHHHVMTVYALVWEPGIGPSPYDSAGQRQIRYTIEERFSDFQTDSGITLPRHYNLRYIQEPQFSQTRSYEWDMTADKVLNNINVDPGNFEIK